MTDKVEHPVGLGDTRGPAAFGSDLWPAPDFAALVDVVCQLR